MTPPLYSLDIFITCKISPNSNFHTSHTVNVYILIAQFKQSTYENCTVFPSSYNMTDSQ